MEPASYAVGEEKGARARAGGWRAAVILCLCAVLLCAALFAAFSLWTRREAVRQEAERQAAGLAHLLAGQLSLQVEAIAATLEQLAAYSRRNGGPSSSGEGWIQILTTAQAGLPGVGSLSVTDGSGDVTFSAPTETMGNDYAQSAMFEALSANPMSDALVADAPARSPVDGRWVLPLGRVNRAPSGTLDGILVATITPSRLAEFYRSVDAGSGGIVWVLSPLGEVLLREPSAGNVMQEPWPSLPLDAAKSAEENSGIVHAPLEAGGAPFLTAYETSPKAGLTIAVSRPESGILAPWWAEVRDTAIGLAVLALALAAVGFGLVRKTPE